MANTKTRKILLACCVAAVILLIAPNASQGCEFLDRLMPWNWCRGGNSVATYAPAYSVQYPVAAQTCNYVPQTSYRTVMRTVPTTVYRPTSYCDPCTGCATTRYRPITSYVRSAQLVPYTTYRPVWTSSCYAPCATPCGTACGTTYAAPSNGCSSCAPAAPTTLAPVAMPAQPANGVAPIIRKDVPMLPLQGIKSVPNNEMRGSSTDGLQLNGPVHDRTTARPVRQAIYQVSNQAVYQPVSNRTGRNIPTVEYGGWRASNK